MEWDNEAPTESVSMLREPQERRSSDNWDPYGVIAETPTVEREQKEQSVQPSRLTESHNQCTITTEQHENRQSACEKNTYDGMAVCRICHGSELSSPTKGVPLLSLCNCRGTMGLCHLECLETWLSSANSNMCEICKFQYVTERKPKPLTEFLLHPGSVSARRNLVSDFICFLILTPLAISSTWLCVSGALYYARLGLQHVEVPGLICLAAFLIITYMIWFTITLRYHTRLWQEWRKQNHTVHVKVNRKNSLSQPSLNNSLNRSNRGCDVDNNNNNNCIHENRLPRTWV
uniref:RING-CH-type domain-containing protein n=1 Tax=Trichuris muris TaxID=70415 RepID=A0A5S6Q999_TRIMR